ncbi:MAG: hypothetical protein IJ763_09930 [Lachnospiraceae bacterium]|nr:hypothetical protein [Lachnospiraceae bacterium]
MEEKNNHPNKKKTFVKLFIVIFLFLLLVIVIASLYADRKYEEVKRHNEENINIAKNTIVDIFNMQASYKIPDDFNITYGELFDRAMVSEWTCVNQNGTEYVVISGDYVRAAVISWIERVEVYLIIENNKCRLDYIKVDGERYPKSMSQTYLYFMVNMLYDLSD